MASRSSIINKLISDNGYKRYLEIGVRDNKNFNRITTPHKDGVDPAGKCNYVVKSDDFFSRTPATQKYDIIFIDGLHTKEQVVRDVNNSLGRLNPNGVVVIHDCNPIKKEYAVPKYKGHGTWNGTVWEGYVELRFTRPDLFMCVVATDSGCGIVKPGQQTPFPRPPKLTFKFLEQNRKALLNLISVKEFEAMKI